MSNQLTIVTNLAITMPTRCISVRTDQASLHRTYCGHSRFLDRDPGRLRTGKTGAMDFVARFNRNGVDVAIVSAFDVNGAIAGPISGASARHYRVAA
jgi:hypothetical protein